MPSAPPAAPAPDRPAGTPSARVRPTAEQCRPAPLASDLRVVLTGFVRRLRWERSSESISDTQYGVLAALSNGGPMSPSALAEALHMQPPPMTRVVQHLADAGLVRRDPHPTDRRQVVVSITEAGEAEVRETRRRRTAWLAQRLAGLTPAEREVLAQATVILRRIAQQ